MGYSNPTRRGHVNYSMAALPDTITTVDEPSLRAAMKSSERNHWLQAINEEIKVLGDNETWISNLKPPPRTNVLPAGLILKLKRDANVLPVIFKARLVVRGNYQDDEDFDTNLELYAPVVCIELVRLLLTGAHQKGWKVRQLYFKGSFLHAILPDGVDIWIRLPIIPGNPALSGKSSV